MLGKVVWARPGVGSAVRRLTVNEVREPQVLPGYLCLTYLGLRESQVPAGERWLTNPDLGELMAGVSGPVGPVVVLQSIDAAGQPPP